MKNTATRATWGILFVLLGIGLAGKAFGLFDFNMFFDGWWTLFIIIPCAFGLSEGGNRTSSMIGLGIGILLLLFAQDILQWGMLYKLLIAFIFIVIGSRLIFRDNSKNEYSDYHSYSRDKATYYHDNTKNESNKGGSTYHESTQGGSPYHESTQGESTNKESTQGSNTYYEGNRGGSSNHESTDSKNPGSSNYSSRERSSTNHGGYNHFSGVLSGRTVQFVDEVFTGAVISSILGNVQLDLRNAIFNANAVIETTCILGGVDIFVPANVKVAINCTPILAGVENSVISPLNSSGEIYTLFINGTCILGGIEVK